MSSREQADAKIAFYGDPHGDYRPMKSLEVHNAATKIASLLGLKLEVSDDVQSILDQSLVPSL